MYKRVIFRDMKLLDDNLIVDGPDDQDKVFEFMCREKNESDGGFSMCSIKLSLEDAEDLAEFLNDELDKI